MGRDVRLAVAPRHPVAERLRLDRRAGCHSDRCGHRIGVLGREAPVLDREGGPVAGCVHASSPATRPWSSTSQDLRDTRAAPCLPATAVARTFGSFRAGLEQLGCHASWSALADTDILAALRAYPLDHSPPPLRRYGTWSAALTRCATVSPVRAAERRRRGRAFATR